MIRNWGNLPNNQKTGLSEIHKMGWQPVMVKRSTDSNTNVGINGELDGDVTTFNIRARIDRLSEGDAKDTYIGLVEDHLLPMMQKSDRWYVQMPNATVLEYKIIRIKGDEIILELA